MWAQRGDGLPYPVRPIGATPAGYDYIVIDSAANASDDDLRALARQTDVVVIPARPSALDLVVVGALATFDLLAPVGTPVRVLLTMTPPRPQRDADEARDMLTARGVPVLKIYKTAALDGCLIRDVPDRNAAALWAMWPRLADEVTT